MVTCPPTGSVKFTPPVRTGAPLFGSTLVNIVLPSAPLGQPGPQLKVILLPANWAAIALPEGDEDAKSLSVRLPIAATVVPAVILGTGLSTRDVLCGSTVIAQLGEVLAVHVPLVSDI
jgi:hypothetical protein